MTDQSDESFRISHESAALLAQGQRAATILRPYKASDALMVMKVCWLLQARKGK